VLAQKRQEESEFESARKSKSGGTIKRGGKTRTQRGIERERERERARERERERERERDEERKECRE